MKSAIRVENLSKRYRVPRVEENDNYRTLRDNSSRWLAFPFRGWSSLHLNQLWALNGVTFEVERGDAFGIIGSHGAGKSTLLKIINRVTRPTAGAVRLQGQVASLLEAGAGFQPELTGRENIYLSGAILGMSRKEIDQRFDEIVDFSGVEQFLDAPVKRYSSGLSVRLGFSVAAHLDADILIVDEVLAVEDAAFQKKCLGKMERVVAETGRTIVFVTQNLTAINQVCRHAAWLDHGTLRMCGPAGDVVRAYVENGNQKTAPPITAAVLSASLPRVA
jgi:lipopolysaccharide transport system ATP-binding protein